MMMLLLLVEKRKINHKHKCRMRRCVVYISDIKRHFFRESTDALLVHDHKWYVTAARYQ